MPTYSGADKELIGKLWLDGKSASDIAGRQQFSGEWRSRNSIIGVVHRLGLTGSGGAREVSATRAAAIVRPKPAAVRKVMPLDRPSSPPPRPSTRRADDAVMLQRATPTHDPSDDGTVGLVELTHRHCRWPVGPATGADQRFCGRQPDHGLTPYCLEHTRLGTGKGAGADPIRTPCGRSPPGSPAAPSTPAA